MRRALRPLENSSVLSLLRAAAKMHLPAISLVPSKSLVPSQSPPFLHRSPIFHTPQSPPTISAVRRDPTARIRPILKTAGTFVLSTALLLGHFSLATARADPPPPPPPSTEESITEKPILEQFLESRPDSVPQFKALVQQKLESVDDEEALALLRSLIGSQPSENEWKFLAARLLNEMGRPVESRSLFEEILAENPLSFEALFESSILMDRCGEGQVALDRLDSALSLAKSEAKDKEARDVRFIIAQILFLQKKVEDSLASYQQLAKEDPNDFRPYFCQGVIYSLLDKNAEARELFKKYKELAPNKFEVDGFLQTPLSRMKIFGSEGSAETINGGLTGENR